MIKKAHRKITLRLAKYSPLVLLAGGGVLALFLWGGFSTALEATMTNDFCISCHHLNFHLKVDMFGKMHILNQIFKRQEKTYGT